MRSRKACLTTVASTTAFHTRPAPAAANPPPAVPLQRTRRPNRNPRDEVPRPLHPLTEHPPMASLRARPLIGPLPHPSSGRPLPAPHYPETPPGSAPTGAPATPGPPSRIPKQQEPPNHRPSAPPPAFGRVPYSLRTSLSNSRSASSASSPVCNLRAGAKNSRERTPPSATAETSNPACPASLADTTESDSPAHARSSAPFAPASCPYPAPDSSRLTSTFPPLRAASRSPSRLSTLLPRRLTRTLEAYNRAIR